MHPVMTNADMERHSQPGMGWGRPGRTMLYPVLHITACSHRLISTHEPWINARSCKAGRPGERTPVLVRAREAQVHLRGKAPCLRKQEGW